MESSSIGLPHTPTRANSAGPSPPRRNLMEDADSSVTRKRPRLDSGERTRRSMSADPLTSAASTLEPSFTPRRGETLPAAARENAAPAPIDRTPSKVTINVRDSVQSGSAFVPVTNGTHVSVSSERGEPLNPSQIEPTVRIKSQSSDVVSVASTPTRSPEIEVAEVEDINEEPGQTKWRPLTNVMDGKDLQEALMKKFPYSGGARDVRDTIRLLANAFEKRKLSITDICKFTNFFQESLEDGEILKNLTHWIERYLQKTEPLESQWWDMCVDEREFWEELPFIVECLIRRM